MRTGYEDQIHTCGECEQEFIWTKREQKFFVEQGFTDPPKQCKDCRQARLLADRRKGNVK